MVHSTRERMSFVHVVYSSVCPPPPFGPARGACVHRGTHTAHKERNIKLQSTRGVTELSVFRRSKNSQCFWFLWTLSVFPRVARLRLLAVSPKGSSLPRLVWVQHYTALVTVQTLQCCSRVPSLDDHSETKASVTMLSSISRKWKKEEKKKRKRAISEMTL